MGKRWGYVFPSKTTATGIHISDQNILSFQFSSSSHNHCWDAQTPECMDVSTFFLYFSPFLPLQADFAAHHFNKTIIFGLNFFFLTCALDTNLIHFLQKHKVVIIILYCLCSSSPFCQESIIFEKGSNFCVETKILWLPPKQCLYPHPLPATESLPILLPCNWLPLFPWLPCFVLSRSPHLLPCCFCSSQ